MSNINSDFAEFALGKHLTAEYYDCNPEVLADPARMEALFVEAAIASGATVLGAHFHDFQPQGISGFVIIAESHISVHAWPEHDYAAVDIFTCGESIDFQAAVDSLRDSMESESVIISSVMNRGIVGNDGVERMIPIFADRTHTYALAWHTRFYSANAWGLLSSVDVYGCPEELLHNEEAIRNSVVNFCRELELDIEGEMHIAPFEDATKGAGFTVCMLLGGGSLLSANVSWEKHCVFLDLFSTRFLEPRIAAEQAVESFDGKRYRMQVAVRR